MTSSHLRPGRLYFGYDSPSNPSTTNPVMSVTEHDRQAGHDRDKYQHCSQSEEGFWVGWVIKNGCGWEERGCGEAGKGRSSDSCECEEFAWNSGNHR